jgi:ABC-type dipeptide/oligopeptide/nickel transport system ATPase subunit
VIYLTCLFVLDDNEVVLNFCHSCIMIAQNSLIIKKKVELAQSFRKIRFQ